jgi:hypothetical protein
MIRARRCVQAISWILAIAIWPGGSGFATTIFVIGAPSEVVIAADSEGTFQGNGQPNTARTVCKFYQADDKFFALAGLVEDPTSGLSVPNIVSAELRGNATIGDALKSGELARLVAELVGHGAAMTPTAALQRATLLAEMMALDDDDIRCGTDAHVGGPAVIHADLRFVSTYVVRVA